MTLKVDWDMHLFEPRKLWNKPWVEETEVRMEKYLEYMDRWSIDIAICHPTRLWFTDILSDDYMTWSQEFCSKSNGRLIPSSPILIEGGINILNPLTGHYLLPTKGVVCIHSTRGMLGGTVADAYASHITPIINAYIEMASREFDRDNLAMLFLECGDWWVDGLQNSMKRTQREFSEVNLPLDFKGLYVDQRSIFGSDFPHFDSKPPKTSTQLVLGGHVYEHYLGTSQANW